MTSLTSRNHKVGNGLARIGATLDCLIDRDRKLNGKLRQLLGRIPRHFVVSRNLTWNEVPSGISLDPCDAPPSNPGSTFTNNFTLAATILTQPQKDCDSSSSSSDSCDTKQRRRSRSRGLNLRSGNPEKKDKKDKKSTTKKKLPKLTAKTINPDDVSELYKNLNIKNQSSSALKGGRKSKSSTCDTTSTDSSESCDEKKCASACVPCAPISLRNSVPYSIILNLQFSPLSGTLQNCNTVLRHRFSSSTLSEIERGFRANGVNVRGGLLKLLPSVTSATFAGYGDRGQVLSLHSIVNFRRGFITLGRSQVLNVQSSPIHLFGAPRPALTAHPRFTNFGLGVRSQFLSGWFNVTILIDLRKLRQFLETATNLNFSDSNNNDCSSFSNNNNSDLNDVVLDDLV